MKRTFLLMMVLTMTAASFAVDNPYHINLDADWILSGYGTSDTYDIAVDGGFTGKDIYVTNEVMKKAAASGKTYIRFRGDRIFHITEAFNAFRDNMKLLGDGVKGLHNIRIDESYTGDPQKPVFIAIGCSHVGGSGLSFWGVNNGKHIRCLFQFNSMGATDSTKCKDVSFANCDFANFWADNLIGFGNSGGGTHSMDLVSFTYDDFSDIYHPLYPVLHSDEEAYHKGIRCDAINNEQTTLREKVSHCRFVRISGRAGAGYGWSLGYDTIAPWPTYGNWVWTHNYFERCYKFLEFNGGGLMRGITVTDNYGFDWTSDNGHATSLCGFQTTEVRNKWIGFDRSGEERYGIEGTYDDSIIIRKWYKGCGGTPTVAYIPKRGIELGGYSQRVSDYVSYEGYSMDDKDRLMPCLLTGKAITSDHQPLSWKGQDNAGMIVFDGFMAKGSNASFIGGEIYLFDNITIKANCRLQTSIQREMVIEQLGDRWMTEGFTVDLAGSPNPSPEAGLYGFSSLQPPGRTHSVVGKIRLVNRAWNRFLKSADYSFSAPVVER